MPCNMAARVDMFAIILIRVEEDACFVQKNL